MQMGASRTSISVAKSGSYTCHCNAPSPARANTAMGVCSRVAVRRRRGGRKKANLGTLLGVYLPSLQNVFGVLMFLRLSWMVGLMGVWQAFAMVFLCCLCTLLTSISVSAVATNGKLGSGGPYYLISRNLGPELGCSIGLLFTLANTVGIAMYLIGAVEILLMFLLPVLTVGGADVHDETFFLGRMTNNFRLYGCVLLLLVFGIVVVGVRFTQLIAPVSLVCIIVSIVAVYAGVLHKSLDADAGPTVCLLGERLIRRDFLATGRVCDSCTADAFPRAYCGRNDSQCADELGRDLRCVRGIPGLDGRLVSDNAASHYMREKESARGRAAAEESEVFQDITSSFFVLLAIYFPSVTGIMTGANISGDLARPQHSIPLGTLAAQLTTSFVYLSFVLLFGWSVEGALLRDKYGFGMGGEGGREMLVAQLSWPHKYVVVVGAFMSTVGAAIQSLCCAPRLLQSIARDGALPLLQPFERSTRRNEHLRGQLLCAGIALLGVLIGQLDFVAPLCAQCFLSCYAAVNLSCAASSLVGAARWRPRFRFYHPLLSLLGVVLSLFLMFSTQWFYALVTVFVGTVIAVSVSVVGSRRQYGDARYGLCVSLADALLCDDAPPPSPPRVLVLRRDQDVGAAYEHELRLCYALSVSHRVSTIVKLRDADSRGGSDPSVADDGADRQQRRLALYRRACFDKHLHQDASSSELVELLSTALRMTSVGQLRPNTLLLAHPSRYDAAAEDASYWLATHGLAYHNMDVLSLKGALPDWPEGAVGTVDVYFIGRADHCGVELAAALCRRSTFAALKSASVNATVVAEEGAVGSGAVVTALKQRLGKLQSSSLRVAVELVALPAEQLRAFVVSPSLSSGKLCEGSRPLASDDAGSLNAVVARRSQASDVVIANLPTSPRSQADVDAYMRFVDRLTDNLTNVLLVQPKSRRP